MRYRNSAALGAALLLALSIPASQAKMAATGTEVENMDPMFIDLTADPDPGWISDPAKLTGRTLAGQGQNSVTLVVTPPEEDGKPAEPKTLTADVDAHGNYLAVFEDTLVPGTYHVKVTAPDQRGAAETTFERLDAPDIPDVVDTVEDVVQAAEDHASNVEAQIEDLPPSPAKDEFRQKLAEAKGAIAKIKAKAPEVARAIGGNLGLSVPIPEMAEPRRELIRKFSYVEKQVQRSAEELKRLQLKAATCDNLEVVIEGLKWVSTMLDFFATDLLGVATNFGKELLGFYANKASTAAIGDDVVAFGHTEAAKNIDVIVKQEADMGTAIGVFTDLGVLAAQKLMSLFCQVFTGPVTAHMKAEFYSGARLWWSYEFDLSATITIHYPKDATGGSIPVKGRIEGYGHNFQMWENALTNLYPDLMASAVQTKRVIPPAEVSASTNEKISSLGSVASIAVPNSFFIAVEGTVTEDKITLTLGPARHDMKATARVLAIILSPLVTFPVWTSYELPFKDARFVFERATKGAEMVFQIETEKDVMKVNEIFADKKGTDEAKGEYNVQIKMCNPGC